MQWFTDCSTVGEIKSKFRTLAKQYHPDRGEKDRSIFQEINAQYHAALEALDRVSYPGTDGKEHTYYYSYEREEELVQKVCEFLALRIAELQIEIVGTWLWVSGNTKPHKDTLKELSFRWHSKRQMWYFRLATFRRKYSGLPMEDLRAMYGSAKFRYQDDQTAVTTA